MGAQPPVTEREKKAMGGHPPSGGKRAVGGNHLQRKWLESDPVPDSLAAYIWNRTGTVPGSRHLVLLEAEGAGGHMAIAN